MLHSLTKLGRNGISKTKATGIIAQITNVKTPMFATKPLIFTAYQMHPSGILTGWKCMHNLNVTFLSYSPGRPLWAECVHIGSGLINNPSYPGLCILFISVQGGTVNIQKQTKAQTFHISVP